MYGTRKSEISKWYIGFHFYSCLNLIILHIEFKGQGIRPAPKQLVNFKFVSR